jgi:hypothetical protein
VVLVGDSTARALGVGLQPWGAETGRLEVTVVTGSGCATLAGEHFKVREGYVVEPEGCNGIFSTAVATAREIEADAFVVMIGSSQLAEWEYADRSGWHTLDEPDVTLGYREALGSVMQALAAPGIPILWADVPTPAWDVDQFGEQLGTVFPGSGPVTLNDPGRAVLLNQLDAVVVRGHPMAIVWPYKSLLEGADGSVPSSVRPDGLHIAKEQVAPLAEGGLVDALERAYDEVVARRPSGLAARSATMWTG